jgi:hypothetical protein
VQSIKDFHLGHQLLPRSSNYVTTLPILFLDAVTFGRASWLLSGTLWLRERRLVVEDLPSEVLASGALRYSSLPSVRTVLSSPPASDVSYNGVEYNLAVLRLRIVIAMAFSSCVNVAAWVSVFGASFAATGGPAEGFGWMLQWALDCLIQFLTAMTRQRPSYMGFAVCTFFIGFIAAVYFVLFVLKSAPRTLPYHGSDLGHLPSVLPLVLDQHKPFCMVSYKWGRGSDLARSLASALPNCWIDVQLLSSGTPLPFAISGVARTAHLLVIMLCPSYLTSANCCIELASAPWGARELHISSDIAQAVWSFWAAMQDNSGGWLNATAWPIMEGVASFWMSKLQLDNPLLVYSDILQRIDSQIDDIFILCQKRK